MERIVNRNGIGPPTSALAASTSSTGPNLSVDHPEPMQGEGLLESLVESPDRRGVDEPQLRAEPQQGPLVLDKTGAQQFLSL